MNFAPEDGPWSIFPFKDGDELLDAHNDILLKFQPNIEPKTKQVIAAAPEMVQAIEDMLPFVEDALRQLDSEGGNIVNMIAVQDKVKHIKALLRRVKGGE